MELIEIEIKKQNLCRRCMTNHKITNPDNIIYYDGHGFGDFGGCPKEIKPEHIFRIKLQGNNEEVQIRPAYYKLQEWFCHNCEFTDRKERCCWDFPECTLKKFCVSDFD